MNGLWKLHISMIGTLALIIGLSTLVFAMVLGFFGLLNIFSMAVLVIGFNLVQWLFGPQIINALYRVKEVKREDSPKLHETVERLCQRSGLKKPKVMIANIPVPNAFAYGSPTAGSHVAVTKGLLNTLEDEEIEAVLGHELGHLKHRDVQVMMFVSILPALFYFIGRSAMFSAYYGGYYGRRDSGGGTAFLIGGISMVVYFILLLFSLNMSRLREYYADRHSASIVEEGPRKLSEGLAKIVTASGKMRMSRRREAFTFNAFKTLFISDPDRASGDAIQIARYDLAPSDRALVRRLVEKRVSLGDRVLELFSTHPNITKRLKALQELEREAV